MKVLRIVCANMNLSVDTTRAIPLEKQFLEPPGGRSVDPGNTDTIGETRTICSISYWVGYVSRSLFTIEDAGLYYY
jgi:hypothetical protein